MQRSGIKKGLIQLHKMYGNNLKLRVPIDHYTMEKHDEVRGRGSFSETIEKVKWLMQQGIKTSVAGRNIWNIEEAVSRKGYAKLFSDFNFKIDASVNFDGSNGRQTSIMTQGLAQFVMCSSFDNHTILHHRDPVCIADSIKPMRNYQGCTIDG